MKFLKNKKFIVICSIICILILLVGSSFYFIKGIPKSPKWSLKKWQEKYDTRITKISICFSQKRKEPIIDEKYYQEIIDTIDNEITNNIRFNESVTQQDVVNEGMTKMIGFNIFFETPNSDLYGNIPVIVFLTKKDNYLGYYYFNIFNNPVDFVIKKMDDNSLQAIYKYLDNIKYIKR